ncbi:MAG: hypothetical protein AAF322_11230, partial [Pseudomonadota bacterium]
MKSFVFEAASAFESILAGAALNFGSIAAVLRSTREARREAMAQSDAASRESILSFSHFLGAGRSDD